MDLAFETSTRTGSVALAQGATTWSEALRTGLAHASDLLPATQRALALAGANALAIERIFVGLGPGSYTGLRVAVAAAVGFAVGADAPTLFGVPSAEALLFAQLAPGETGLWLSDARSDTLYALAAERTADDLIPLRALHIVPRDQARALQSAFATARRFTDLASDAALQACADNPDAFVALAPHANDVLALGRARAQAGLAASAPSELEPLYLRDFAAKVAKR